MDIQITDILLSFLLLKMRFAETGTPVDENVIKDFLDIMLGGQNKDVYDDVLSTITGIEVVINATLAKQMLSQPVPKKSRKTKKIKY